MGDGTGCDNMTCVIVVLHKSPSSTSCKRNSDELESSEEQHPEKRAKVDGETSDGKEDKEEKTMNTEEPVESGS